MRSVIVFGCALVLSLLAGAQVHAAAHLRVALVIGNGTYEHAPHLANPLHDAQDMAAALGRLGYSVQLVTDARKPGMEAALAQLARDAAGAEQVLVYFAGHGIEVNGVNYLLPLEARVESENTVPLEAVSLPTVMNIASSARQLGLVVLDACRDNPLANSLRRANSSRGTVRGLAAVEASGNLLVAYAAREGNVAQDGTGRNSPYTAAILQTLQVQGLEVSLFWRTVRDRVRDATQSQQVPVTYGDLGSGQLYLNPPAAGISGTSTPSYDPGATERSIWQSAQSLATADGFRDYLEKYPNGQFSVEAKLRIAAITRPSGGSSTSSAPRAAGRANADGSFRDCESCPEMVNIPAGRFLMGSPPKGQYHEDFAAPLHAVTIRAFAAARYAVTRGQWREYLTDSLSNASSNCRGWDGKTMGEKTEYTWSNPGFPQEDDHPLVCITWQEAQNYVLWLSHKAGHHYRLLSDSEFEYIDRAGSQALYSWGDSSEESCRFANVGKGGRFARCTDGFRFTSPVGHFPPNRFGLYDTGGDASSWTQDCVHANYNGAPADGRAWEAENGGNCNNRIIRGGTFLNGDTASHRRAGYVGSGYADTGLRVARAP